MCQPFDDFDANVSSEEFYGDNDHEALCPDCGSSDLCECHVYHDDEDMDGDFDSGMASAGHGTDEDYGYYGEPADDWDF